MSVVNEAHSLLQKMQAALAQIKGLTQRFPNIGSLYAYQSLIDSIEDYIDDIQNGIDDAVESENDLKELLANEAGKDILSEINNVHKWLEMGPEQIIEHNKEHYGYE